MSKPTMLVLSRYPNEAVIIGPPDNPTARVVVVDVRGSKVRLGFAADPRVQINREEIARSILAEKEVK